jgi:transposase
MVIERGFRSLKTELELRPVYHRNPDRIKAHVLLCFLALLLIRVAENETYDTWFHLHRELKKLNLVTLTMPSGIVRQTTEPTARQKTIMSKCKLKLPPKIWSIDKPAQQARDISDERSGSQL